MTTQRFDGAMTNHFFEGDEITCLSQFLNMRSDDPTPLFKLSGRIVKASIGPDQVTNEAATHLEEGVTYFLRALRLRFRHLDTISGCLTCLEAAFAATPQVAGRCMAILAEAASVLASQEDAGSRVVIRQRLKTAWLMILADEESHAAGPGQAFFKQLIATFDDGSPTPRPLGDHAHEATTGRRHRRRTVSAIAVCAALLIAGFFLLKGINLQPERIELTFIGHTGPNADPIEQLGPGQPKQIRDGQSYSQEEVTRLLASEADTPNCFVYRITHAGITLIAAREGTKYTFPPEIWETPVVLPGTGYETFVLIHSRVPREEFGTFDDSSLSIADRETLAGSTDETEIRGLLRKAFAIRQRWQITRIQFARAWHSR